MRTYLLISILLLLAFQLSSNACTEVLLNKKKGLVVSGRTLDYNCDISSKICFRQKGKHVLDPAVKWTTLTSKPLEWTAKYDAVLVDAFDEPAFVDAFNTEGLSIACLWHADTEPAQSVAPGTDALSNVALVEYIAENAATVDEAKALISKLSLFLSNYKGQPMTLHWIITERSGKSTVMELKNGKPRFFDEVTEVGVMANQPSYDKQLANLKEHLNARSKDRNYTLPGDYQSTSRFVKSAFLVSHLPELTNCEEGASAVSQILHNVESPKGAQPTGSYTQWFAVRDQSNLVYYFIAAKNQAKKSVDLKTLDFAAMKDKRIPLENAYSGSLNEIEKISSASSAPEQLSK